MAIWHVVRGKLAIFDSEWLPRMGTFWTGVRRPCVRATSATSPLLLAEMRAVCIRGESALARMRQAVTREDFPTVGCSLGPFL